MTILWVCDKHDRPEGTCPTCSVVKPCPPDKMFTAEEVAVALKRARELAEEQAHTYPIEQGCR